MAAMPIDDGAMFRELERIINSSDLLHLTIKSIMVQLEQLFGPEIHKRKADIKQKVSEILDAKEKHEEAQQEQTQHEQEERERQEESDADSSSASEPEPEPEQEEQPKKKGKRAAAKEKKPKAAPKKRKTTENGGAKQSGLQRPVKLSAELAAFVGAEEMSRTDVNRKISQYVKAHDLQVPEDKRRIRCDDALKKLLNTDEVTFFSIQKFLAPHFPPAKPATKRAKGGQTVLSDALAAVVGSHNMPRQEVVRQVWAYIKEHQLQDPSDKRNIRCDSKLRAVFGKDGTNMLELNRLLSKHFLKVDKNGHCLEEQPVVEQAPQAETSTLSRSRSRSPSRSRSRSRSASPSRSASHSPSPSHTEHTEETHTDAEHSDTALSPELAPQPHPEEVSQSDSDSDSQSSGSDSDA